MDIRRTFATVLRRRRLAQSLSQEQLAGLADISMRSVSLMECNRQQPTISVLEALAKALDTSMSELLRDVEKAQDEQQKRMGG